ncbi:MAG: hypothetical protein E7098_06070 [Mediterranea massiliensis]|nr:hypothetical protein [Mediterranea massiliensis]
MKKTLLFLSMFAWLWVGMACSGDDDLPEVPKGPARPTMNVQDSLVMVAYYHSMKCAEWKEPYHWDITDYTTWGDVTAALDTEKNEYRIVKIRVGDPKYLPAGYSLPTELGNLPYLTWLEISGDERAKGGIPKEIFNCPLELLYISGKGFGGEIPKEIGNVAATMKWLYITGTSCNTIPEEIALLQNLGSRAHLGGNEFSGTPPLFLRDLPHGVNLWYNYYTEMDWRFFTEEKGIVPELDYNWLSGEIPEEVFATENWKIYGMRIRNQRDGYWFSNWPDDFWD